jgi:hypothetical protein
MLLNFSQEEYDKMPSPKRTWVMERIMEALGGPVGERKIVKKYTKKDVEVVDEAPRETPDDSLFGG